MTPSSSPSAESGRLPRTPPCPFCEKTDTELMNAFGSHASVSTYWCRACRSPFELLKWRGRSDGTHDVRGDAETGASGGPDEDPDGGPGGPR